MIGDITPLARLLGIPYFPVTPSSCETIQQALHRLLVQRRNPFLG